MATEKWVSWQDVKVLTLQQQCHRKIFLKYEVAVSVWTNLKICMNTCDTVLQQWHANDTQNMITKKETHPHHSPTHFENATWSKDAHAHSSCGPRFTETVDCMELFFYWGIARNWSRRNKKQGKVNKIGTVSPVVIRPQTVFLTLHYSLMIFQRTASPPYFWVPILNCM